MSEDLDAIERRLQEPLNDRIEFWDELILAAGDDPEQFQLVGQHAVAELDTRACRQFGVKIGEKCVVSGPALWSETVVTEPEDAQHTNTLDTMLPQSQLGEHRSYDEYAAAKDGFFVGFVVRRLREGEDRRLWYVFQLKSHADDSDPLCVNTKTHYMYVDPVLATITPTDVFEEPYMHLDSMEPTIENGIERIHELRRRSDEFVQMVGSSDFKGLEHADQVSLVDSMIREAEATIETAEAKVILSAEYGYIPRPDGENGFERKRISLRGMVLRGICLALDMTGRENLAANASGPQAPTESSEGLVVALEVRDASGLPEGSLVKPKSIVHVPVSGQEFSLFFH